ncbi:PadR family transcriptional regulator [Pseudanabaena sp. PCC 6802]|uniref:PadR family transcriptional regulator n=1 Tax=Pseudanabaena sp. PCC 6802 TaxID=118173 RepID=UPI00034AADA4|nr:PadR family transcriptional regulator [Pseudanabaena sp. PCC 6802]
MSLSQAILASLVRSAQSGYDLAKSFDGSVGFFWEATHQQIYRELNKLEDKGAIAAQTITQEGRPAKKLYSLTDRGLQQLKDWLHQPCELSPTKEELLLKVFAGHLVEPEAIAKEIKRHRQLHAERLTTYRNIEREYFSDLQSCPKEGKFGYLTLLSGIKFETGWVEWCDEALEILSQQP